MSIFSRIRDQATVLRIEEESLYEAALEEIERGGRRPGLWAKAIANSGGDEGAAKALYVKLLVQKLKDEAHIEQRLRQKKAEELAQQQEERRAEARAREREEQAVRNAAVRTEQSHQSPSRSDSPAVIWVTVSIGVLLLLLLMLFVNPPNDKDQSPDQMSNGTLEPSDSRSAAVTASKTQDRRGGPDADEYNELVTYIEERYPQLNPDHVNYNQQLVDRVLSQINHYEAQAYSGADALLLAVDDIFGDLLASESESQSHAVKADRSPQTSNTKDTEDSECNYKGVMTDQDYRNCGIEPPR